MVSIRPFSPTAASATPEHGVTRLVSLPGIWTRARAPNFSSGVEVPGAINPKIPDIKQPPANIEYQKWFMLIAGSHLTLEDPLTASSFNMLLSLLLGFKADFIVAQHDN
jgi:hypothetical protein